MNKYRVVLYVVFLYVLSFSLVFSKTEENKKNNEMIEIVVEVSPVYNILFFDKNPLGKNKFYSTQFETRIGISLKKERIIGSVGIGYLDSKQIFNKNDFSFYNLFVFAGGDTLLSEKFRIIINSGLGFYNFKYKGISKYSYYIPFSLEIGYRLFDDLFLTLGFGTVISSEFGVEGPKINGEETRINVANFSLGFRYYFDLF